MQKWARFRDMRPPRVDSNLYNYHLKLLQKNGLVEKVEGKGYRLSPAGLRYVDYVSVEKFVPRHQPKLITKLLIVDEFGDILMWPKYKQPFIGAWSLPSGKVHFEDASVADAARRELAFVTTDRDVTLRHAGVIEVEAGILGQPITHILEHLFCATIPRHAVMHELAQWKSLAELEHLVCSPGTREAIELGLSAEPFTYRYVSADW